MTIAHYNTGCIGMIGNHNFPKSYTVIFTNNIAYREPGVTQVSLSKVRGLWNFFFFFTFGLKLGSS